MPPDYSKAACKGVPSEIMFPERGEDQSRGKAICRPCPIKEECLEDNLTEEYGIWGETTPRARRAIRRERKNGTTRSKA